MQYLKFIQWSWIHTFNNYKKWQTILLIVHTWYREIQLLSDCLFLIKYICKKYLYIYITEFESLISIVIFKLNNISIHFVSVPSISKYILNSGMKQAIVVCKTLLSLSNRYKEISNRDSSNIIQLDITTPWINVKFNTTRTSVCIRVTDVATHPAMLFRIQTEIHNISLSVR